MALHPNMFLLNQQHIRTVWVFGLSLHPNMFLLNQLPPVADKPAYLYFTSQYVSIKSLHSKGKRRETACFTSQYVSIKSLHSKGKRRETACFTSQYVSIKSQNHVHLTLLRLSLHPNMFLLNLKSIIDKIVIVNFTSQYVSIKSIASLHSIAL